MSFAPLLHYLQIRGANCDHTTRAQFALLTPQVLHFCLSTEQKPLWILRSGGKDYSYNAAAMFFIEEIFQKSTHVSN